MTLQQTEFGYDRQFYELEVETQRHKRVIFYERYKQETRLRGIDHSTCGALDHR